MVALQRLTDSLRQMWKEILQEMTRSMPRCYKERLSSHTHYSATLLHLHVRSAWNLFTLISGVIPNLTPRGLMICGFSNCSHRDFQQEYSSVVLRWYHSKFSLQSLLQQQFFWDWYNLIWKPFWDDIHWLKCIFAPMDVIAQPEIKQFKNCPLVHLSV